MGMSIDESLENLKTLQIDYQQFHDDVWQDPESYGIMAESLQVAVETMQKYQKIQEIYERYQKDGDYYHYMAWIDVMEVLEDGNDN
jgi:hypothetical protein